ncbi:MAG: protein kinase [Myxococcota bacterium]|nr:protein kinase [Myxococcota bacterium]
MSEDVVPVTTDAVVTFLARIRGFARVPRDELEQAARVANLQRFSDGDLIIAQGARGHDLHIVYGGKVRVPLGIRDEEGRETVVELGVGHVFGELGFLTDAARARDVYAAGDVVTLSWSRVSLYHLLTKYPPLARFLSDLLGRRLAQSGIEQVGKYRIVEHIGRGATATVFHAYNPSVQRAVALKMLNHSLVFNKHFRDRFIREAHTLAKLSHPHIVQLYDMESQFATYFMVMEYVDGKDLYEVFADQPRMEIFQAGSYLAQVGRALAYLHGEGVVHGDVKPPNCLVEPNGNLKLTDFGICRCLDQPNPRLDGEPIAGTPEFMAPEVLQGEALTPAADIYALGVMAYQMYSGTRPFRRGTFQEIARAHIEHELKDIQQVRPEVPDSAADFIRGALVKDPKSRLTDWTQIAALLEPAGRSVNASHRGAKIFALRYPRERGAEVEEGLNELARRLGAIEGLEWLEGEAMSARVTRVHTSTDTAGPSIGGARLAWMYEGGSGTERLSADIADED